MKIEEVREKVENEIMSLEPIDYVYYMFDRTDENGIVLLQDFSRTDTRLTDPEPESIRCKLQWNVDKRDSFAKKLKKLLLAFEKIAEVEENLNGTRENAKAILKDRTLFEVWEKYIMPFDTDDFDSEKIAEIGDKMETVADVKEIAKRISEGKATDKYEKEFLTEYIDVFITDEEEKYYDDYRNRVYEESKQRMGKQLCAYYTIIYAMRLTKLYSLKAPTILTKNEGRNFAKALLINEYGISAETVDDLLRLNLEKLEMMTDDELDELFKPRKTNNRKSMAPLFVYLILKEKTNVKKHFRQQEILEELKKYPYEISIERKALSRIVHNLMDSQLSVMSDKTGVWFEKDCESD